MDRKDDLREHDGTENTEAVFHRNHRLDIVAIFVCLAVAFFMWLCVMNSKDTDYLPLEVTGAKEGYTYTLSVDSLEVEGVLSDLKRAKKVLVILPGDASGVYTLTPEDLILPEGVCAVDMPHITLTVRAN